MAVTLESGWEERRNTVLCKVLTDESFLRQRPVAAIDSPCDSLSLNLHNSAERNAIPSPLCERSHDSDVRYESPPLRAFHRVTNSAIAHRKFVYVRMPLRRIGRSRGVISSDGSTTDQRISILESISCDPKTCISLNSASKIWPFRRRLDVSVTITA
jgi:hypothetical protein